MKHKLRGTIPKATQGTTSNRSTGRQQLSMRWQTPLTLARLTERQA